MAPVAMNVSVGGSGTRFGVSTKNERYVYQRLYVSLISAGRPFVEWLQAEVQRRSLPGPQTAQSRTVPAGAE